MLLKFTLIFFVAVAFARRHQNLLNLSDYDYPRPEQEDSSQYETIAILGTNDLHGHILPLVYTTSDTNETYTAGGMLSLFSYIKILKNEWGNRFLWLDAGDLFQGSIEGDETTGVSTIESINYLNFSRSIGFTIGNHDFDYGIDKIVKFLNKAKFSYMNSNIYRRRPYRRESFTRTLESKIYRVGSLNIGVFSLTTNKTPFFTPVNLTHLHFQDYLQTIRAQARSLRKRGADVVILLGHMGMTCRNSDEDLYRLGVRFRNTSQKTDCSKVGSLYDELYNVMENIPEGLVDAIVAGHTHIIAHHWVNKIPVVQSRNKGRFFNILYLKYDKINKRLVHEDTAIEGPVPVCEKVFKNFQRCDIEEGVVSRDGSLSEFTFHNKPIERDSHYFEFIKPYLQSALAAEQDKIGYIEKAMNATAFRETELGNFVADIIKNVSLADVSICDNWDIRINWPKGEFTYYRLYDTIAMKRMIVSFEITGAELKRAITIIQTSGDGFMTLAGVRQVIDRSTKPFTIQITLPNGDPIEDTALFRVGTTDYVIKENLNFMPVKKYYVVKNLREHADLRDSIEQFVRKNKFLSNDRFKFLDPLNPRWTVRN